MPNTELYDNTPVFPDDKKHTDCEDCNGTGNVYGVECDEPFKEPCTRCEGTGQLEVK